MAIKVKKSDQLFVIDVKKARKGLKLSAVKPVAKLPGKLGIDHDTGAARVGLRLGPAGDVEVIGLDKILRGSPLKSGRC
jgi:hypothetical protein